MTPTQSILSVYKTKAFVRFARRARIADADLWRAAEQANRGLIDADLGGGVIKQRIARAGQGKSGGSRTIIAFKTNDRAIYIYGFEKKDQANIDHGDLSILRKLAQVFLTCTADDLVRDIKSGELVEVHKLENEDAAKVSQ